MLIFANAKLVFLSVPKTGTTAIESALASQADIAVTGPPELKHAPVYRYNRFFRPMIEKFIAEDMEVIAVMREPVSWLGSWYRYRQRPFLDGKPVSTAGMSFDAFVEGYLADPRPPFANVGAQSKFIEPRPNGTRVDRLFKYEELERCTAYLQTRLGVAVELPHANVSVAADLSLDPARDARLRAACAEDFALWSAID